MICTKITVKYLLRILTITTNKRINSILISRNANPQDGCGGIIIYHKLASVLHSRSCRYALDINTDLSSLSFADVPEITAMIKKKRFCATLLPFTFWQRRCLVLHSLPFRFVRCILIADEPEIMAITNECYSAKIVPLTSWHTAANIHRRSVKSHNFTRD